jgi:two-component system cell cycle response regulator
LLAAPLAGAHAFLPILIITEQGDDEMVVRALDLGVNDYIVRPVDPNELVARSLTQMRRKSYNDRLRANVQQTIELAVTDPLTGLSNRRYLDNHISTLFNRSMARGRPLSVLIADIDRFKQINDTYGHDAGDDIIREFANRVRSTVRGADLACRYGGEEFVVVMPDTSPEIAASVAERLRSVIETVPFVVKGSGQELQVTASFGIASRTPQVITPDI